MTPPQARQPQRDMHVVGNVMTTYGAARCQECSRDEMAILPCGCSSVHMLRSLLGGKEFWRVTGCSGTCLSVEHVCQACKRKTAFRHACTSARRSHQLAVSLSLAGLSQVVPV